MSKKIIAVFGATGAQGGGVARAILNYNNSEFAVRAVTRDTNSEKAKELAKMGAELVAADIDNKQSMKQALHDAYGAYFVTFSGLIFHLKKNMEKQRIWPKQLKKPV